MPTLWALLVGIRNYPLQDWPPAAGAHSDLRNVFKYLTHDMNTPQEHILRLQDDAATREGIISTFKSHLIDNPKISRGDALLFYYSGHGSYVKAPTGWTIVKGVGDDRSDDMIEVILPYDENAPNSHDGSPTCAIPDRTLAAFLDAAAAKHGRNITVILDCCSSGHGTRADTRLQLDGEDLISRDIDPSRLTQLPADLDHDLVAQLNPEQPDAGVHVNNRRGRFPALGANHVLLAACKPREQAQGTDGFGGILTTLWLSAMRNKSVRPRTYANVTSTPMRRKRAGEDCL
ncbi:hypothetical protein BC629DRAFT_5088 [Irpex lacteus]|nr:hypothetical protein BC629DRAFT_5088 [Irpex lacteus]